VAVAVKSSSTLNLGNRTNTTFTAPSGIVDGDLLLMIVDSGRDPVLSITAPSGFSTVSGFPVTQTAYSGTYQVRTNAFYKIASGESGNYATTHTAADTEGIIFRIDGGAASPFNPAMQYTDHPSGSNGGVNTAPTITPAVDNSLVIWFGSCWDGFGATSPPTGTTPTFTEYANDTAGVFYCAAGVLSPQGATGTKDVNNTQVADRTWLAGQLVVEAGGVATGKCSLRYV
jgi:hypothetical protein